MHRLFQDLRYGWRALSKSPVFTLVTLLTLALGIGANTAIFTLINAALLRPLPFAEPDRLVQVWEDTSVFGLRYSPVAMGNFVEWRAQNRVFDEMGAIERRSARLAAAGGAEQIQGSVVTAGLFRALGVQPALGRPFHEDEDRPGAPRIAILSDGVWRRAFGADVSIVGRTVQINDEPWVVTGVMPAGFSFPDRTVDFWVPAGAAFPASEFSNKGRHNAMVVARLKPGVSVAQANQDIGAIASRLQRDFPRTNARIGAFVAPLREHYVADVRTILLVLAGAVGFVLLIGCANIANLLLSRASERRREVAIRAAIGASRGQVARQLLTENLMLAAVGGLCGLAMAVWSVKLLAVLVPPGIASLSAVTVDLRVLGFTLAVSLITGVTFALAPLFDMLRVDLHDMLRQGGTRLGTTAGSASVRRVLVVSEVALAFVLVVGAALFIRSFARLRGVDAGFPTANLLTVRTPLTARSYRDPARRTAFYNQVLERVRALPGVVSAGFTNGVPLVVKGNVNGFAIEGRPRPIGGPYTNANYRVVSQDYLKTIGVPLREGRYLERGDTADAPPVTLINEAAKRKYWPNESAIGKRFRFGDSRPWITIVGVIGDIRQSGPEKASSPEIYLPAEQNPETLSGFVVRTKGDPKSLAAAVRREIAAVDKDVPIADVVTMEDLLDREVFQRRVQMLLLAVFAAVALLLASIGIYGVLACLASQRTKEIGIRMALGAAPRDILLSVAGQGVGLSLAGIALGAVAALALARVVSGLLFGIAPNDGSTFTLVAALLLAVASAASYIPAWRAMRVDPILALREE